MIETNIFKALLHSSEYFNAVIPYLKKEYFKQEKHKFIFSAIQKYLKDYSKQPSIFDIKLIIEQDDSITMEMTSEIIEDLKEFELNKSLPSYELIFKESEKWCQDRALEIAILESVNILEKNKPRGVMEELIKNALAVSFQTELGHDYFKDAKKRFQKYKEGEEFFPLQLNTFNEMLGGGLTKKAIYVLAGKTNVGKCSHYDTYIDIRNKKTGEIEKIKIGDFYKMLKENQ